MVGVIWFSKSINDSHNVINASKETTKTKVKLVDGSQYVVDSFTVTEDMIISIILKGEKTPITVDFKNPFPNADYYCNILTGASNTLNGTYVIQKSGVNQIRLSEDLEKDIKTKLELNN